MIDVLIYYDCSTSCGLIRDTVWFIHELEVRIWFWSSALWPSTSCASSFPLRALVLYGEMIPQSSLNQISPPPPPHHSLKRSWNKYPREAQRDTVSYGTALTWTLLLLDWKAFTSTRNQNYASDTPRNQLQSCLVFHSILDLLIKIYFWANFTHRITFFYRTWLKTVFKGTWTKEVRNA